MLCCPVIKKYFLQTNQFTVDAQCQNNNSLFHVHLSECPSSFSIFFVQFYFNVEYFYNKLRQFVNTYFRTYSSE